MGTDPLGCPHGEVGVGHSWVEAALSGVVLFFWRNLDWKSTLYTRLASAASAWGKYLGCCCNVTFAAPGSRLMGVARNVDPMLPLLITLMDTTGRRLSSVLGLRWDDFDFEAKTIRFRAELDKRRKTWTAPLPRRAERELLRFRARCPAIGSVLVFPSPRDADKPVSIYLALSWLERAYAAPVLRERRTVSGIPSVGSGPPNGNSTHLVTLRLRADGAIHRHCYSATSNQIQTRFGA